MLMMLALVQIRAEVGAGDVDACPYANTGGGGFDGCRGC